MSEPAQGDRSPLTAARELLLSVDSIVPHTDADGLAAGALALRARGESATDAILLRRGETPFGVDAPLPAGSVAVLDWGIRDLHRPGLFVDHHAPEDEPQPGQIAISGYGEEPETTTAALVRRLVPEGPAWVAAVGAGGDLGTPGLALPEAEEAPRGVVRRLIPLINAPRRIADGPVREALALLVEAPSAQAALRDPRVALLETARATWRAELDRVRRTPPQVGANVAVVRFSSPAQVHPLVATQWQKRLAPRPVIAANDGYLPGRVNFSIRGGSGDLRRLLRDALPEAEGEFAHGHDRATGGSLPPDEFELLIERLNGASSA